MKRSEYIALGAVGLLAVATFWPTSKPPLPQDDVAIGKGDGFQTLAFSNLEECKQTQIVTASSCDLEFEKATKNSIADAPKFETQSSCESEYGASACRPATWNGTSVFVPALAGVLIARALTSGAAAQSQPLYPPRSGPASCPLGAQDRPECGQRSSGGGSSSAASSGSRYYSTGTGRVIGRAAGSTITNVILPSRTTFSRSTITRAPASASSSTFPRSPSSSSSSPTTSRGGFGSTSRSYSSSGS